MRSGYALQSQPRAFVCSAKQTHRHPAQDGLRFLQISTSCAHTYALDLACSRAQTSASIDSVLHTLGLLSFSMLSTLVCARALLLQDNSGFNALRWLGTRGRTFSMVILNVSGLLPTPNRGVLVGPCRVFKFG